jgi:hypothetical protein
MRKAAARYPNANIQEPSFNEEGPTVVNTLDSTPVNLTIRFVLAFLVHSGTRLLAYYRFIFAADVAVPCSLVRVPDRQHSRKAGVWNSGSVYLSSDASPKSNPTPYPQSGDCSLRCTAAGPVPLPITWLR